MLNRKQYLFAISFLMLLFTACISEPLPIDKTLPIVSLTVSSTNITEAGSITLTATVTDDTGIHKVEFYRDGEKIDEDQAEPYEQLVELSFKDSGNLEFSAIAFDLAGNSAESAVTTVAVIIPNKISSPDDAAIRQAIEDASPDSVIVFDADVFSSPQTITLDGQLFLDKNLTIEGPGRDQLILDANGVSRIFELAEGVSVTLSDMTISGGLTSDRGGAIFMQPSSNLTMRDCRLAGNRATIHGGAILNDGGTLTMTNCSLEGNLADINGGAIHNFGSAAKTNLDNVVLEGNRAGVSGGGVLNFEGIVTLKNSNIRNNQAENGGAVYNLGTLTVDNSLFESNQATFNGGGIYNIAELHIKNKSKFIKNIAPSNGGAIYNFENGVVTLEESLIGDQAADANTADSGAGIYNFMGKLSMSSGSIRHNMATGSGGGIYNNEGDIADVTTSLITDNIPNDIAPVSMADISVVSFTLINADTDTELRLLTNGDTINYVTLGTQNLSIRANTEPPIVGSVAFTLDGSDVRLENIAPYSIAGDTNGGTDYQAITPPLTVGDHSLTATPYSSSQAEGLAGLGLTISFQVVNSSP